MAYTIPFNNVVPLSHIGGLAVSHNYSYIQRMPIWQQMDDCYNGDVKRYAQRYIAPPSGLFQDELSQSTEFNSSMSEITIPVAENSTTYTSAAKAYALGGFEPDLVQKTIKGFASLVEEHDPIVEVDDELNYFRDSATNDNKGLTDFYFDVVHSTLLKGRVPIYLDIDQETNQIKFVKYPAESLVYWRTKNIATDVSFFEIAILKDMELNPEFDPIDNINNEYISVYYKLWLDDGVFTVTKYYEDSRYGAKTTIVPSLFGKTLDYIPLITVGSLDNTPDIDAIPLLGIANCVISIYSLGCMLSHAEKTSAVPTMYVTGVNEEDAPSITGANVCLTLPDYTSKVGYTVTDTSAMTHIRQRMDDYYLQAQELGASLLGSTARHGTESGEALRLRQASSTSTLKSVVTNVGEGIEKLLQMAAVWMSLDPKNQSFEPNTEFSTFALTANETVALVQAWQSGAMAKSTLVENFRKAGMLKAGDTTEDEIKKTEDPDEQYFEKCGCQMPQNKSSKGENELDIGASLPKANTLNKAI